MTLPAASCGVSKTSRNEASFGEYDPKRFNFAYIYIGIVQKRGGGVVFGWLNRYIYKR